MKKFDLVCLNNNTLYKNYGIEKNMHGIIIEISQNYVSVMFFNPHNLGEATLIDINKNDISIDKENLPDYIKVELENNIERIKSYCIREILVLLWTTIWRIIVLKLIFHI